MERAMCEKCVELDRKIVRYRELLRRILDQVTIDRANELIAEMEAQKARVHPVSRVHPV